MQSHTAIGRVSVTGHKPTGHAKDGALATDPRNGAVPRI